jgi:hypothetical protein
MKKGLLISVISLLVLTGCGSPAVTVQPTITALATTQAASAPTDTPAPTMELAPSAEPLPAFLTVALPHLEPLQITTKKDIPYAQPSQPDVRAQNLDIYYPTENGSLPVVVIVPPINPYRNTLTAKALGEKFAGQGMVVFILDGGSEPTYYLGEVIHNNGKLLREVLEEISCGMQFAQAKAGDYGGDPNNMIVFGYGIGATYGLDAALQGKDLETNWEVIAAKRGNPPAQIQCLAEGEPAAPKALVSYGGDFNFAGLDEVDPELAELIYPAGGASKNTGLKVTLFYNVKRYKDDILEYTTKLKDGLDTKGLPVELFMVDAPSQSICSRGPEMDWITNAILQYTKQ